MSKPKVVMITGAARRVGAELVRHLHQAGMNIVLHYRSSGEEATILASSLNSQRADSVKLLKGDLKDYQQIPKLVKQGIALFGRIDALINNASSFYPTDLKDVTEEIWEDLVGVNLKAPLYLTQTLATELKKNEGCIINIVDIHGDRPLKDYSVYSIAKAGLIMFTKSMARELAPEIRVNGIAPGAIMWPEEEHYEGMHQEIISRTALKREGCPHDIAETALFLIDHANYITGQIIAVDGGRTLSN
ncbi:MAG: pteridine reductase [Gammaproteobacteria bacterium]|nr:MAG: pteridine reductase [Gammaproteobacteria bacterium]